MYDLIIVGGGPAAVAAGVYAARKRLRTLVVTENFESQSFVSDKIENWIGEISISGFELAQKLEKHLRAQETITIQTGERATSITTSNCTDGKRVCDFLIKTKQGNEYTAKSLIIVSGGRRRKLGIPGEEKFMGTGVAFCATCDAPIFKDKDVAVVGGGNAGLEAVVDLLAYARKIYVIVRGDTLRGDPVTQEEVKKHDKVEIIYNAETQEILGDKFVSGLRYKNLKINDEKSISIQGVFVEIGSVPNSEMVKELVELNKYGEIVVDAKTAATSHPGIFAAGDVTDDIYKQNNIAVGDGVRAALSAYNYILNRKKETPASA